MKQFPFSKFIQKTIFLLVFILFFQNKGIGQLLQWNTFGNTGLETTEPSVFNDANISSSNLTLGSGITPASNGNRFGGNNWFDIGNTNPSTIAEAIAGNNYIEFIVTPLGGYTFTPTSFVFNWDKSGTGPQNVVLRSSFDGFSSNIGIVAPTAAIGVSNTIIISGLTELSVATTFRIYGYGATGTGGTGGFDLLTDIVNVQLNGVTCTSVSEPAVNASAYTFSNIGCNGVKISWNSPVANDSSLVVMKAGSDITSDPVDGTTYVASSTYGFGTDIGTSEFVVYNGSGTSVVVTGLSASTTYYFNVFEYNGTLACIDYRTSDEVSSSISTVSCDTCAYMTSALINSCDLLPCREGDNEMLFFNSGNYYVNTDASNITVNYGSSSPAPTTYADSFISNSTAIDSMNADTGCSGVYIDASTLNYIPPNSSFLILNETICADAFDWSSMCAGSNNIYVLFSSDLTWNDQGQFSNSPPASGRFFRTIFEGCTTDYRYDSLNFPLNNGAIAFWSNSGGLASSYDTNGCSLPATVLPIKLLYFTAKFNGKIVDLNWSTTNEINNDYFTIERSSDAFNFEPIGFTKGAGNSYQTLFYSTVDKFPLSGVSYYRLKQTDFDGSFSFSNIESVVFKSSKLEMLNAFHSNEILNVVLNGGVNESINIELYDIIGKKVKETSKQIESNNQIIQIPTVGLSSGIYLLKVYNETDVITRKIKF